MHYVDLCMHVFSFVFMNSNMRFHKDGNRIIIPENLHFKRASVSVIRLNCIYLLDTTIIQKLLFKYVITYSTLALFRNA